MEDQGGRLDSDQKEKPALRKKSYLKPRELTIMVIGSVGRIRSFTITRRVITLASIFLLAYIFISLYVFNSFFDLRYRYGSLSEEVEKTADQLDQHRKKLVLTERYVEGLEDYIRNSEERAGQAIESSSEAPPKTEVASRIVEDLTEKGSAGKRTSRDVDIRDIVLQRADSVLDLEFKLANVKYEENPIEGYIHIIAADKNNGYPHGWNYRSNEIRNGMPVNFSHGQPFLIQRFKPYHRQFNMDSELEFPALIKILIYDRSGDLILKKEIDVGDVS